MVIFFHQLLYIFGLIAISPLLGVLWYQGQRVRATIPKLSDPTGTTTGVAGEGQPLKMLVVGESTVAGLGVDTFDQSITAKIARRLCQRLNCQIHWTAFGISGVTAHALGQAAEEISQNYDLIIICLGGNDAFGLHSPLRWMRDCRALVHALRRQNPTCPILFADVPPIRDFSGFTPLLQAVLGHLVLLYRQPLRELAKQEKEVYFTDKPILLDTKHGHPITDYFSDGVHPSDLTYSNWADDLSDKAVQIYRDLGKKFI